MASYTLDDIRSAADRKYGSTDIEVSGETVRLLNPLRLTKAKRDSLLGLQEEMVRDDADQAALLSEAIRTVAQSETAADSLLTEIGGDLAVLAEVFGRYGESTQAGEASASHG
ncbi:MULTISPECIES: phage tail assembly protein [Streptomyces]|uniref:phage tail assembly protein n=1 Tax=Streptomyces TaxID=1883 RepID=UPI002E27D209|nr:MULTISPECIES: phage tail assembly protein [Streptomyces]